MMNNKMLETYLLIGCVVNRKKGMMEANYNDVQHVKGKIQGCKIRKD